MRNHETGRTRRCSRWITLANGLPFKGQRRRSVTRRPQARPRLNATLGEREKNEEMKPSTEVAVQELSRLFQRNGYVRLQNTHRYQSEGYQQYKKGDEVRLIATSETELTMIQHLLAQTGFTFGRPFAKANQLRQPIYGREAVRRFLQMVQDHQPTNSTIPTPTVTTTRRRVLAKDITRDTAQKQGHPEKRPTRRCSRPVTLANAATVPVQRQRQVRRRRASAPGG